MNPGISKWYKRRCLPAALFLVAVKSVASAPLELEFSLHKHESAKAGPTLLVIGGIQGDEPGGFNAASLLVTNYTIGTGNVWVVPNLNFESIIKRSRGVYGDMNRKFLILKKTDPEYLLVQKIKSIILSDEVDVVLNLHDGSGFYRPSYIDKLHNPYRWGQSIIIDQKEIVASEYASLHGLANAVVKSINKNIVNNEYKYRVRNTQTRQGDKEMEKTLTYFAIRNQKPAFGIEASKQFGTSTRAYYHLQAVEAFMQQMGIKYKRDFGLDVASINNKIEENVELSLYDSRIYLDMAGARNRLRYIPMKKNAPLEFEVSNPLMTVIGGKNSYKVRYGNRHVTMLHPEYFEFDESLDEVELLVDGQLKKVKLGSVVNVKRRFNIKPVEEYRVNVIGFRRKGYRSESGVAIGYADIAKRFSVDKQAKRFRVEFYRKDKFCGMLLVDFGNTASTGNDMAFMSKTDPDKLASILNK